MKSRNWIFSEVIIIKSIIKTIAASFSSCSVGKFSVQQFDNDKFSTKLRNSWRYEHDNTINSLCCPNQYSLYKNTPCSMYHISLWNTDLPKSKHELTLNASALKYEWNYCTVCRVIIIYIKIFPDFANNIKINTFSLDFLKRLWYNNSVIRYW